MTFQEAIESGIQNYANFSGRARRSEFWFFALFAAIAINVVGLFGTMVLGTSMLYILAYLPFIVPSIAVGVRRMHDIERSGMTLLFGLIPVIGGLYVLYLEVQPGTVGDNQYGPETNDGSAHVAVAA